MEKMTYQEFCGYRRNLIENREWEELDKLCREHTDYMNKEADAIYRKSQN